MSSPSQIQALLEEARAEHVFSGYLLHAERHGNILSLQGGTTSYWPGARPVESSTLFDIGSVTKAVVAGSVFGRLFQAGKLSLDEPVSAILPDFRGSELGTRTVTGLLNHCSGLVGWYPIYQELVPHAIDGAKFLSLLASQSASLLTGPEGQASVYSDIGYLLLGAILEARGGGPLNRLFEREVVSPLGLRETAYGPVSDPLRSAATEYCLFRRRLIQGEVFDENSFALGGETAHAGLFSTARDLARWALEWLNAVKGNSSWLSREVARLQSSPAGLVKNSTWGYGWDTRSAVGSTAGKRFSLRSFGHLGFPGCSVWIDPEAEGFAILLTNRVHPSRWDERIRQVRPRVHDEIALWWEAF